jgi:3-hydroxybutyryl-CoA dehydratase
MIGVGHRIERRVRFTKDDIVAFAEEVGDWNPLHHDEAYASGTRFGGMIASGAHTVAHLMALCGAQATAGRPGVGLEFGFRLLGAAFPDEEILFRWEVVSVEESERPKGVLVSLRGEALGANDRPILSANAKTLFVERL